MTTYTDAWGRDETSPSRQHALVIADVEGLDTALDRVAREAAGARLPFAVDLYEGTWTTNDPAPGGGMQFMIGHPDRSWLSWLGDEAGIAEDPSLPPWPGRIACDRGGQWDEIGPDWLKVTEEQARQAAREYVRTGRRPSHLHWLSP